MWFSIKKRGVKIKRERDLSVCLDPFLVAGVGFEPTTFGL